jgi:thiosulfate reductase cytochrome b subunit
MAEAVQVPRLATGERQILDSPRHSGIVRITHWVTALCFLAFFLSGTIILLAHPRLYWGEAGNETIPSLIDLPVPFIPHIPLRGESRALHFVAAWISVLAGLAYVISGLIMRHFSRNLLPGKKDVTWDAIRQTINNHLQFKRPTPQETEAYNLLQRLTYLAIVFFLFPLVVWTGLAMSPGLTSVFPTLSLVFGGHQSARTIHFFAAFALVLFVVVHITMVSLSGFRSRVRAMITGRCGPGGA